LPLPYPSQHKAPLSFATLNDLSCPPPLLETPEIREVLFAVFFPNPRVSFGSQRSGTWSMNLDVLFEPGRLGPFFGGLPFPSSPPPPLPRYFLLSPSHYLWDLFFAGVQDYQNFPLPPRDLRASEISNGLPFLHLLADNLPFSSPLDADHRLV